MRKTNEKSNKGITLIALIITIIVMLILVSVTIAMAVNGGLFDYAKKASSETKNAIEKEQALGSGGLNIAGTWYNSIDEYIKEDEDNYVEISEIAIGDYISNYPVQYVDINSADITGWRVLGIDTDSNGKSYLKLTSAGVPLSYHHPYESGAPEKTIENLTTKFLTTEIDSTNKVKYKFYNCGFNIGTNTNLSNIFINDYTTSVRSITRDEIGVAREHGFSSLLGTWLPERVVGNAYDILCLDSYGRYEVSDPGGLWSSRTLQVRPVIILKSDVKFSEASSKIDDVATWEVSI